MKLLTALAALTLIAAPAAQADWGGGTAQTAASAYCGARAAGQSQSQASKAAHAVMAGGMRGSFTSNIATIITSGKSMKHAVNFQIQQMCPEYFGGSSGDSSFPRINRSRTEAEQAQLIESFRTVGNSMPAEDNKACTDPSVGPATKAAFGC